MYQVDNCQEVNKVSDNCQYVNKNIFFIEFHCSLNPSVCTIIFLTQKLVLGDLHNHNELCLSFIPSVSTISKTNKDA